MDTLAHRLAAAKAQLLLQAPRVVLMQAQTGLALVVRRLQSQGLPGRTYSTNPLPKFYFQPTNAGGRAYLKREKKPTYKGIRGAQGMEAGFVNLTYTGRMLRSLQPVPAGGSGTVVTARLVASDRESAEKLAYNFEREGDFLAPNAQERITITQVAQRELDRIVQQALNG